MYLSMILGANFSSESGPEIPLNVSLIIRFGGHVTTKKGITWLFANEKGSHLWQASTPPCSNGVAQMVHGSLLPPTVQRLSRHPAACPTSAAARHRVPDSQRGLLPQRHATPGRGRARGRTVGGKRARLGLDLRKAGATSFPQENVPLADGSAYPGRWKGSEPQAHQASLGA